jgi:DNA-binding transcriptional LysR family regulator
VVILPSLVKRLAKNAPQVDLRVFPLNRLDVVRELESGQIDLVIGWFGELPGGMRRATLFREQEAIVVREGHPLTQDKIIGRNAELRISSRIRSAIKSGVTAVTLP